MPWFFSRGNGPKITKPITRRILPALEQLETRLVFSANVWLPEQLQPLEGAAGYDQSFQLFQPAVGGITPSLGMSSAVATLSGSFSLTDTGAYSLALSATGPDGESDSFEFDLAGTSVYCLTVLGSVLAAGFSVASVALTQTVSLVWEFFQKNESGDVLSESSGTDCFTLAQTPPGAPFDPFFAPGFNWLGPSWRVSSDNGLGLPSLSFAALTVSETDATTSYAFAVSNGDLAVAGNVSTPLYDSLNQNGQESYSVTYNQNFGTTTQGTGTFTLFEAGSYAGGSFALASVVYNETGTATGVLTETATRADMGTGTASGLQSSAGGMVTFSSSAAQSYALTNLSTVIYSESAGNGYALSQSGTFGSGQFSLSCLSYGGTVSGGFSLTRTDADTQTGTVALADSQAATNSMGVAGTLTGSGATVATGTFTDSSTDTITENQSGMFTFSELGAYGNGSWTIGTLTNGQSLSGTYAQSSQETYVEHDSGTVTNSDAGNDSYTLNYGSAQTTSGTDASSLVETLSYTSVFTETDSASANGIVTVALAETGAVQAGTYSLSAYLLTIQTSNTQQTQDSASETDTGTGTAQGTISGSDGDANQNGGTTGSDLSGGDVYVNSAFSFSDSSAQTSSDAYSESQVTYQSGVYAGGAMSLGSATYNDKGTDSWSFTDQDSSVANGSETDTGQTLGQVGGSSVLANSTATAITIGTVNYTSYSNYTSSSSDGDTESGFTSWTDGEQGLYAGYCFTFANASYRAQGTFTDSSVSGDTQSYIGTYLYSAANDGTDTQSSALEITSSTGIQSTVNDSTATVTQSGTSTDGTTSGISDSWSLNEAGSFGGGSWSLSSISYSDGAGASWSDSQTETDQQSGAITFSSAQTNVSAGTVSYGGIMGSQGTILDAVSGHTSFSETDNYSESDQDNDLSTFTEQGSFSGQSYNFPSVTYQDVGSSSGLEADGSTITSSGQSVETSSMSVNQSETVSGADWESDSGDNTQSSTSSYTTSGTSGYQESTLSGDAWTVNEAGSYAGYSLSLSSYSSTETTTYTSNYQGSDNNSSNGLVTDSTAGSDIASVFNGALISGSYDGTINVSANFTTNAQDSYSGSSQGTATLVGIGQYSNASFNLSSVVFHSSDTFSASYGDSGSTNEVGTMTDDLVANTNLYTGNVAGVVSSGDDTGSVDNLTSVLAAQDSSSYADQDSTSGTDSLSESGTYSGNSYSLTSVAYTGTGQDSYSDSATDDNAQQGQQTETLTGTDGGQYTIGYGGTNSNGGTITFGDTITLNMSTGGNTTSTSGQSGNVAGGDSWTLNEYGNYSGYSYAFSSVVYQGTQTQSMNVSQGATSSFIGGTTKSAGENVATTSNVTMGIASAQSIGNSVLVGEQDNTSSVQSMSENSASTVQWYDAGSYGGGVYTFTSDNQTVSVTNSSIVTNLLQNTATLTFGATTGATGSDDSGNSTGSNTYADDASMDDGGQLTLTQTTNAQGTFNQNANVSYTEVEIGSYSGGSFAMSSYTYNGTQSGGYTNDSTRTLLQTLTATGSYSYDGAYTDSSEMASVIGSGYTLTSTTVTVSDAFSQSQYVGFNGTISTSDTLEQFATGGYTGYITLGGSYSAGSFAYSSMTYGVTVTQNSYQDAGLTISAMLSGSDASAYSHTGASVDDSSDFSSSDSYAKLETVTGGSDAGSIQSSIYALSEQGSMSGQSWNLSSFNLVTDGDSDNWSDSGETDTSGGGGGSYSQAYTWAGVEQYNVSGSFGATVTTVIADDESDDESYAIDEGGTYGGADFSLSDFAYTYSDDSQATSTDSETDAETFSGTDNVGEGSSNPTYSGTGGGSMSSGDDAASSASLGEQGSFAGGSFSLSSVSYAGAATDSYSDASGSASSWSGGYSGSASAASADSGNDYENISAAGSYSNGSYSLSSYTLGGASDQGVSDSSNQQDSVSSMGMTMGGSSFASSDASSGSSSLYQSGTQYAGSYANNCYSYQDGSDATMTATGDEMGASATESWTQQTSATVIGGGTQASTSAARYSYPTSFGGGASVNNTSTLPSLQPASTPAVQFAAPDPSLVAQAQVGTTATPAIGQTSDSAGAALQPGLGQSTLGQSAQSGTSPAAGAPVPANVNTQAVPATGTWASGTQQAAQQVVTGAVTQQTQQAPQAGAAAEASQLAFERAYNASFGMEAWTYVAAPVLKLTTIMQASGMTPTLVKTLSLDDPGVSVAATQRTNFASTSSDPLVQWVDQTLYNNGQPLTAGSLPIYGDGTTQASAIITPQMGAMANMFADSLIVAGVGAGAGAVSILTGGTAGLMFGTGFAAGFMYGAVTGQGSYDLSKAIAGGVSGAMIGLALALGGGGYIAEIASGALLQGGWDGLGTFQAGSTVNWGAWGSATGTGMLVGAVTGAVSGGLSRGSSAIAGGFGVCGIGIAGRFATRAALGFAVGAGTDAVYQGMYIRFGQQSGFNWTQMLAAGGAGAVLGQFHASCFSGRMLIDVQGGRKRADAIQVGDLVASRCEFDPEGPVEYKQVEEVFVNTAALVNLHVGGTIIETTGLHPFYAVGRGWIEAGTLQMGDLLLTPDGQLLVVHGVAPNGAIETVYNLRVADHHTYFVAGEEWGFSVWAHNSCGPTNPYRKAGLPTRRGQFRFIPPTGASGPIRGPGGGYMDRFGNEWAKGPPHHFPEHTFEWDVQLRNGGYRNVSPTGIVG